MTDAQSEQRDGADASAPPRSRVTAKEFHDSPGVEDWRVLFWGAHVHYSTSSFAEASALVAAIAEVVDEVGHEPDVDVRPHGVTVRTFSRADGALSPIDAVLAASISRAARGLGLEPDPSHLQTVGIAVAEGEGVDTRPFWAAALGYEDNGDEDATDPLRRGPHLWFHPLDPAKPGRGRTHIDVSVPRDVAEARVADAVAAGGRIVRSNAPHWWTIASPDNHGIDVAAWADFEDGEEG